MAFLWRRRILLTVAWNWTRLKLRK